MFNLGFTEMIVLGVIALLVIGPKQLPEMARVVGRLLNEFKRATGDIGSQFTNVKKQTDQTFAEMQRDLYATLEQAKIENLSLDQKHHDEVLDEADSLHLDHHHSDDEHHPSDHDHSVEPEQLELHLSPKKPNSNE